MGKEPAVIGPIIVVIVTGAATLGILFVLGMRAKSGLVLRPIVAFSKVAINPRQLRTAGTPGAYAGIVRHRGRVSGRAYETPVGIVAEGDGFLIALPYGTRAQWVRNVLASGSAVLVTEGSTHEVDRAELVAMDAVFEAFPESDRRGFRLLKTDQCLRLHRAAAPALAELQATA
jgi:deazaflavin-dependent oxidoreductase (nitroreductase family)